MEIQFEQVDYDIIQDVRPILTNLVHTSHHWHQDLELILVCSGSLVVETQGVKRTLKEGDFYIINSSEIHSVNSVHDGTLNGNFLLQIGPNFFRNLHINLEKIYFRQPSFDEKLVSNIQDILLKIIQELMKKDPYFEVSISGYCSKIIAILCRNCLIPFENNNHPCPRTFNKNIERIKRVVTYIRENYKKNPSISDVASTEFISPNYFSHMFSNVTGMTYSQYLNDVKIDMVLRDLIKTDHKVMDIMLRHGFSNSKTFHRVFKQRLGCSPTAYRKKIARTKKNTSHTEPYTNLKSGNYINFKSGIPIPSTLYRKSPANTETMYSIRKLTKRNIFLHKPYAKQCKLDGYFKKITAVGRASDLLYANVQNQLKQLQSDIGFSYIRFHNIFGDEMGIVAKESTEYNFAYVNIIFDFLMEIKLKPFLELSFMPTALASGTSTVFFYKGNITPPKKYEEWEDLVFHLVKHLVCRYTLEEVSTWYFEIWNEPNLSSFWTGSIEDYILLYESSAKAIKRVDPCLRIGGPSISSFQNGEAKKFLLSFLKNCKVKNLPVDFISAHPYPVFYYDKNNEKGVEQQEVYCDEMQTKKDIQWILQAIQTSHVPQTEIHLNEWNSSSNSRDFIHDTAFMATFVIQNYLLCKNMISSLAFWSALDLFEEEGVPNREFHGGFGLLSKSGLKKPQYFGFFYLNRLGEKVLEQGDSYIITQSEAKIQILCWNYCHYNQRYASGDKSELTFYERYNVFEMKDSVEYSFTLTVNEGDYIVETALFDRDNGSVFDLWIKNGAIEHLSPHQLQLLHSENHPKRSLNVHTVDKENTLNLTIQVEPFGFSFMEISKLSESLNPHFLL